MSTYVGLSITTPEEVRKGLEQTQQEDCKKYRLETFDKFIKDWNVAYFFNQNFKWDIKTIAGVLPGLSDLLDHTTAFVDADNNCFFLLQPYNHVKPEEFCKENDICEYVDYWLGGYHNDKTYAIVISGDFLTYIQNHLNELYACNGWRNYDASIEQFLVDGITKIEDIR